MKTLIQWVKSQFTMNYIKMAEGGMNRVDEAMKNGSSPVRARIAAMLAQRLLDYQESMETKNEVPTHIIEMDALEKAPIAQPTIVPTTGVPEAITPIPEPVVEVVVEEAPQPKKEEPVVLNAIVFRPCPNPRFVECLVEGNRVSVFAGGRSFRRNQVIRVVRDGGTEGNPIYRLTQQERI